MRGKAGPEVDQSEGRGRQAGKAEDGTPGSSPPEAQWNLRKAPVPQVCVGTSPGQPSGLSFQETSAVSLSFSEGPTP